MVEIHVEGDAFLVLFQHGHRQAEADDGEVRITAGEDEEMSVRLRRAEQSGRPVGGLAFVAALERRIGRRLFPALLGPKPAVKGQ
jgi:hypothetical protein